MNSPTGALSGPLLNFWRLASYHADVAQAAGLGTADLRLRTHEPPTESRQKAGSAFGQSKTCRPRRDPARHTSTPPAVAERVETRVECRYPSAIVTARMPPPTPLFAGTPTRRPGPDSRTAGEHDRQHVLHGAGIVRNCLVIGLRPMFESDAAITARSRHVT